jgi:hypothetical protein
MEREDWRVEVEADMVGGEGTVRARAKEERCMRADDVGRSEDTSGLYRGAGGSKRDGQECIDDRSVEVHERGGCG